MNANKITVIAPSLSDLITTVMKREAVDFEVRDVVLEICQSISVKASAQFYTIRVRTSLTNQEMKLNAGSSIKASSYKYTMNSGNDLKTAQHMLEEIVNAEENIITLVSIVRSALSELCLKSKPTRHRLGDLPALNSLIMSNIEPLSTKIADGSTQRLLTNPLFMKNKALNIEASVKYDIIATPKEVTFSARRGNRLLEFKISNSNLALHDLDQTTSPRNVAKCLHLIMINSPEDLKTFAIDITSDALKPESSYDIPEEIEPQVEAEESIPDLHPDTYELSDELKSYFPKGCITKQNTIITVQHYNTEDGPTHTIDVGPILIKVDSSFENVLEFVITPALEVRTVVMDIHLSTRNKSRHTPAADLRRLRDANSFHFRPSRT